MSYLEYKCSGLTIQKFNEIMLSFINKKFKKQRISRSIKLLYLNQPIFIINYNSMSKIIIGLLILTTVFSDVCSPYYWEVDPSFAVPVQDLDYVASKGLQLTSIQQTKGIPIKTTYLIQDIKATVKHDPSARTVVRTDTSVTITEDILNINFTFKASSKNLANSSKRYSGVGTAEMVNLTINYTKSAQIKNGKAGFFITSATVSAKNPAASTGYTPQPSDPSEFESLIKTNLTNQVVSYYKDKIQTLLTQSISDTNIPFTFENNPYIYKYKDVSVSIDMTATNLTIAEQGYTVGYNGSVAGFPFSCDEFFPPQDEKASYLNYNLVSAVYNYFLRNNKIWDSLRFDQTNANSTLFNYYMIDIEEILPSALIKFPNYFDRLYINCGRDKSTDIPLQFDPVQLRISSKLGWNCGLYRASSDTNLLNFNLTIAYQAGIYQQQNVLQVKVLRQQVQSIEFAQVQQYVLKNKQLAELYIKQIANDMVDYNTVGTGFLQPSRQSAVFQFLQKSIKISDGNSREMVQ